MPIGDPDIVQTASRERIMDFYKKWYRPELMTVVIVGDADPALLEREVRARLSQIPASQTKTERPEYSVSLPKTRQGLKYTDPEAQYTLLRMGALFPAVYARTDGDYRELAATGVAAAALTQRLREIAQGGGPFLDAACFVSYLIRPVSAGFVAFIPKTGMFTEAFQSVLDETDRFIQFGITESELERHKADLLADARDTWQNRDKTESSVLAGSLVSSVLTGAPVLSPDGQYQLARATIEALTVKEVNAAITRYFAGRGTRLMVSAPDDAALPSKNAITRIWKSYHNRALTPYDDGLDDRPLFPSELAGTPGTVVSECGLSGGTDGTPQIIELTLSNGARVLLCPTDFKEDTVSFNAVNRGGLSLVADADFPSASAANEYVEYAGLNGFTQAQITKKLAGKNVWIEPILTETAAGFQGAAAARDMEVLFQLINLYFNAPSFTETAWNRLIVELETELEGQQKNPGKVFSDELRKVLFTNAPRFMSISQDFIDALDSIKTEQFYRQFYGDAGNFTFIFTGSLDVETIRQLSAVYLASLPGMAASAEARDTTPPFPAGKPVVTVKKGIEDKSMAGLIFGGVNALVEGDIYIEQDLVQAVRELTEIRLRERLREKTGAIYDVGVYLSQGNYPARRYSTEITFGCDPARTQELTGLVLSELESLRNELPAAADMTKVRESFSRRRETALKTNAFWQSALWNRAARGDQNFRVSDSPAVLAAMTAETMQRLIQRYFNLDNYITGILLPEGTGE
jgi:zinc protease